MTWENQGRRPRAIRAGAVSEPMVPKEERGETGREISINCKAEHVSVRAADGWQRPVGQCGREELTRQSVLMQLDRQGTRGQAGAVRISAFAVGGLHAGRLFPNVLPGWVRLVAVNGERSRPRPFGHNSAFEEQVAR